MISTARQHAPATQRTRIPRTTPERQQASLGINSLEQDTRLAQKLLGKWDYDIENGEGGEKPHPEKTVLYLAYGSNMDTETFTGKRGIRPVSLVNVYVPELRLTFDLAALPYLEPCYATVRYRHVPDGREHHDPGDGDGDEKQTLVHEDEHNEDRKRWNKPLVGVVYELTACDYAWMISTESGGRGYRSGTVTCYPFPESYDPADEVPDRPTTQPFQAQSLLSLVADDDSDLEAGCALDLSSSSVADPRIRPNPSYGQPSERYHKLLYSGAVESDLPFSYRDYLLQIHEYQITTSRQRIGKMIFIGIWGPLYNLFGYLSKTYAQPDGYSPPWLALASTIVYTFMWKFYDMFFVKVFGDGERTIGDLYES